MTLGIVKRTEDDLTQWLATESGFISGLCQYDNEPVVLEPYQQSFLGNHSRFRWVAKSRQVGFSFLFALEALARCHLRDGHTSVFVSYNLSDAVEKVLIARQVYEELPLAYQKKLVTDAKTELAFESNSRGRRLSRIISVPAKPPRGKRGDVYLDELAHLVNDREVYTGSTALILRSHGQLTGGSTPLGRRGIFWEIDTQELRKYPHHTRQLVPWWLCRFFSLDVRRAAVEAPLMPTEERVTRFGRPVLVEQFDSLPQEDFQQEFECLLRRRILQLSPLRAHPPVHHRRVGVGAGRLRRARAPGAPGGGLRCGPHERPLGAGRLRGGGGPIHLPHAAELRGHPFCRAGGAPSPSPLRPARGAPQHR
ncbi:terminase [Myxococcus llanfairpwllgwyngyllgogerychwyrndrobwllllantysiliogogogochensis]|uniref:Terminase n=1 Tax=Myxococcus llanfairpwllgwyngyllgogerychwyrndrobwllllantysiliogogogochensis TaxID=2590453 RepID=A0A540WJ54_9BACT|nr:terminase [Myxococcus llanfairpwllgwyngyllgogerychwyrndrobwllllantysiliogogogochensis]TQF09049.1 terminase [Myxococcus llanfairpwllgwyngyllgogerychwyrndrobwllllantysiliogogogochensis]